MPVLSNLIVRIGASTDDFDKKVNASLNKIKRFGADVAQAGQALSIGISAPLALAGAAALKAASDMETLSKGLSATMKSTSAAADELQRLKEVAKLPGLGLEEAVKGSIRLQTLGNSAADSRRIMSELGNALAVVGGGREDFSEVIRQLSQLGAVGKVTKENLDPIIERIPQIAAIIKEKFGAAALGNPAETFEKLGISSQQFIRIIVDELAKGDRAGGTFKNSLENLRDAATQTAAEFGKVLLPVGQRVIDEFLNPGVEKAKALAADFNNLSPKTQTLAVELAAVAAAAPVVMVALGTLVEKGAAISQAFMKMAGAFGITGSTAAVMGQLVAGAAIAIKTLQEAYQLAQAISGLANELDNLLGISQKVKVAVDLMRSAWAVVAPIIEPLIPVVQQVGAAMEKSARMALSPLLAAAEGYNALANAIRFATGRNNEMQAAMKNAIAVNNAATTSETEAILKKRELDEQLAAIRAKYEQLDGAVQATTATVETYKHVIVSTYEEDFKTAVLKERLSILQSDYTQRLNDGVAALVKYGSAAGAAAAALREMRIAEMPPDIGSAIDIRKLPAPMGMPGLPGESVLTGADQARSAKRNADMIKILSGNAAGDWKKTQQAISRQVSTIVTDLSRGLADIIVSGGKVGQKFEELGKQIAKSLVRTIIENGINKVIAALGGLMANLGGVGGALGGLLGGTGARTATSAIPGVLGGGANAAMGAIPGISSAAGSASSGMGSAMAAANPVTAVVNAVAGVVSAVSSVISNFQFAAMNKTLDLIEKEVRYSQIHLLHLLEKNNEYLPKLKDIWDSLIRMETRGMAVGGGGAPVTINISTTGDTRQLLDALTRELKLLGVIPQ
jgi:tape measure domain-containing protein